MSDVNAKFITAIAQLSNVSMTLIGCDGPIFRHILTGNTAEIDELKVSSLESIFYNGESNCHTAIPPPKDTGYFILFTRLVIEYFNANQQVINFVRSYNETHGHVFSAIDEYIEANCKQNQLYRSFMTHKIKTFLEGLNGKLPESTKKIEINDENVATLRNLARICLDEFLYIDGYSTKKSTQHTFANTKDRFAAKVFNSCYDNKETCDFILRLLGDVVLQSASAVRKTPVKKDGKAAPKSKAKSTASAAADSKPAPVETDIDFGDDDGTNDKEIPVSL
jgi:hypothetical protein